MAISPVSTLPSAQPLFSSFTQSGIPNATGTGYAYPPGSDMVSFMDNLNNTVAAAGSGPTGGSVMDWANGLLMQSKQRQAMQQQAALMGAGGLGAGGMGGGMGGGVSGLMQMYQMLMSMMSSMGGQGAAPAQG